MLFRKLEVSDVATVLKIFEKLRNEEAEVSFVDYDTEDKIKSWIDNPDVFVYVAEVEGKIAGVFKAIREGKRKKHSVFLTCAVDDSYRKMDIAKNITNYGLGQLKREGIVIARAYIFSNNRPSINTILSCGFTFGGSVHMHHLDEKSGRYVDDLIFHKILNNPE